MGDRLELDVARSLEAFEVIEPALDDFFDRAALSGRPAFVARMVVEETVRNVVEHGTGGTGGLRIEIDSDADWVEVAVLDDGEPFDPDDAPELDVTAAPEERGFRGMGVHLMRGMTDGLHYEQIDGYNRLVARIDRHRAAT